MPSPPPIEPDKLSPYLKTLLASTGDLFDGLKKEEVSEWLITDETLAAKGKAVNAFTLADREELEALMLKKAAAESKSQNATLKAIQHEVALLKILPDSVDARIRLHDYLTALKGESREGGITDDEVEILVDASAENSMAREILNSLHSAVSYQ